MAYREIVIRLTPETAGFRDIAGMFEVERIFSELRRKIATREVDISQDCAFRLFDRFGNCCGLVISGNIPQITGPEPILEGGGYAD